MEVGFETYEDFQKCMFEHRADARKQTLSRVSKEIDLIMANIASLSKSNPRLLRQIRELRTIFSELGLDCYFFNEEMSEVEHELERKEKEDAETNYKSSCGC